MRKGDELLILGRLRTNFVQKPDGNKESRFEVRAEEIRYGRTAKRNLQAAPVEDSATRAVDTLNVEFALPEEEP
jgi:single-stranded DNA-binding protein